VLESTQSRLTIMTLSRTGTEYLTKEEWNELNALRKAINYNPHTVSPEKMEKFTELMVRSLEGKGDPVSVQTKPTNY
jgi:hypothetical protein